MLFNSLPLTVEESDFMQKCLGNYANLSEEEKKTYKELQARVKTFTEEHIDKKLLEDVKTLIPKDRPLEYYQGMLDGIREFGQLISFLEPLPVTVLKYELRKDLKQGVIDCRDVHLVTTFIIGFFIVLEKKLSSDS